MRVLVTGHLGYIGTVAVPMLREAGHDVVGLDCDYYRGCNFDEGGEIVNVPQRTADIRDVTIDELRGFDAIIHLAALSNDPLGNLNPDLTFDINHRGTMHLATCAREAGVQRFLYASSCSNYGAGGGAMLAEDASFNPVTPYGESKVLSERDLAAMADASFCTTSLRCATAYGVSPRMRFDLVLNNLVAWAYTTGKVHIKSDGTPWRPIVHIRDIITAYMALLEAPMSAINGRAFNVGRTGENYQIRDIARIVAEVVPDCEVEIATDASPDTRTYRVNCDLLSRTVPAFTPEWTAQRGAEEAYEAYRRAGLTLEEFEGPRYKRIDRMTGQLESDELDDTLRYATTGARVGSGR